MGSSHGGDGELAASLRSPLFGLDAISPAAGARLRRSWLRRGFVHATHRKVRQHDVVLASYPRSGNTWLSLMLAQLILGRDVGIEASEQVVPFVKLGVHMNPRPPLMRTHEPYRGEFRRAIYLHRDVRDVAISYLQLLRASGRWRGTDAEFMTCFADGRLDGYGSWQSHVEAWFNAPRDCEVMFVAYSDLRADPAGSVARIAAFIGIEADTDRVQAAVDANTIGAVREKERVGTDFMHQMGWRTERGLRRRGAAGTWKTLREPDLHPLAAANGSLLRAGYRPIPVPFD